MPLDPQAQFVLDQINALPMPPLASLHPAQYRQMTAQMPVPTPEVEGLEVRDLRIPGPGGELTLRLYRPLEAQPGPALMFFHGGGFVIGDLESHDGLCRMLAQQSGALVAAVDYRLAPEAPFPAAPEDCYAATCWVAAHAAELGIDATRLAVAGDSAGGNLAIAVSRLAQERGGPALRHQLLFYPVTDCRFDTPSYRENAEGYLLSRDMMQWFWGHYLESPEQGADPLASPLRSDSLAGLPPATVITAEYDPLRDEGEAFARRMQQAGVVTRLSRYDGVFHGFASMLLALDAARRAVAEGGEALRQALA
ncbi:MAG: alpha/beta hydrolase [Oceanospirillaceae bacterium]|nr:alpha/beta hydrolase [Oceanospirillaceae bacterium]